MHLPRNLQMENEVGWEKGDHTSIEAEFEIETKPSTTFDLTGKWLGTEIAINKSQLPEAVRRTQAKEFRILN